jgi:hypothetical protein
MIEAADAALEDGVMEAALPPSWFVYPVIREASGEWELGTRMRALTEDIGISTAESLARELGGAFVIAAFEYDGIDDDTFPQLVGKFGNVPDEILLRFGITPKRGGLSG